MDVLTAAGAVVLGVDLPDSSLIGIPSAVLGLAIPLVLILRNVLMLTTEHERRMAIAQKACEDVAKAELAKAVALATAAAETHAVELRGAQEQVEAAELRVVDLQNRVDHLIVDRDAWREASEAQAQARLAAEHAATQLMESQNLGLGLLAALKDALAHPPRGTV